MQISTVLSSIAPVNEDRVISIGNCVGVIDGATGLSKGLIQHARTDGDWIAERILHLMTGARIRKPGESLLDAMRDVIAQISGEFGGAARNSASALPFEVPSASVAVVRWTEDEMEYLLLGDAQIAVGLRDGGVRLIEDGLLAPLDAKAISELKAFQDGGLSHAEALAAIGDTLRANRARMNRDGGYWTCAAKGTQIEHVVPGTIPLADVSSVAAASDGFYRAISFRMYRSWNTLLPAMLEKGPQAILNRLRAMEDEDPKCLRFPRFKKSDDASAVAVRF